MESATKVIISDQAFLTIVVETYSFLDRETGGIFLVKKENSIWFIVEVIDPGYGKIVRDRAFFEYDEKYVTHLANVRSRLYENGLDLLGLWHRHPRICHLFSGT